MSVLEAVWDGNIVSNTEELHSIADLGHVADRFTPYSNGASRDPVTTW